MSGAYSTFPLQLVVVFNLTTCFIRNALAAGVAAVDCIRPLGGEDFSAAFADSILPFFQSPLFQIFLITPVPAQTIIAIFLAFDQRVEIPSATLADDFPYNGIWSYTSDFFFIPLSQRFLIFVFPIAVPPPRTASADTAFCCALSSGKPHSSISHRSWSW